ncbi:hypothetical protein Daesc_004931 [Daldinia eschscholtzii]|uniref:Uncharacterized protein n=1 Tax=Daldinia eschscholtzii TaxID=292717 RepID=A0AAX6MKC4_9PEZI
MASSNLPLKVRVGIRDHWENTDAPLQVARSALKEILGIDVVIEIDWDTILLHLNNDCPDKSTFAPFVATAVRAFLDGLREILDADLNPEWTNTLLENAKGCLRIFVGVTNKEEPITFWSTKSNGFQVNVPRSTMMSLVKMQSSFKTQLDNCFDDPQASLDDWADVSIEAANKPSTMVGEHGSFDLLPDISILPRPDDLLLKPPYHLTVYGGGNTIVEVQCSHSPTLELLGEYLKKWCKLNHRNIGHPPAVEVELHQSSFGFGLMYDRLTLTAKDRSPQFLVSPMIVLPFVEGVLGYKSVSVNGSSWVFRRDIELRKSGQ